MISGSAHPYVKIARKGYDFCDTYTTLKNASASNSDDIAVSNLKMSLEKHLNDARAWFFKYNALL